MFKRIISLILAVSLVPVFFVNTVSAAEHTEEYDASIFGNNAEYLLEEHFAEAFQFHKDENKSDERYRRPSGWDVDYRGGLINTSGYSLS